MRTSRSARSQGFGDVFENVETVTIGGVLFPVVRVDEGSGAAVPIIFNGITLNLGLIADLASEFDPGVVVDSDNLLGNIQISLDRTRAVRIAEPSVDFGSAEFRLPVNTIGDETDRECAPGNLFLAESCLRPEDEPSVSIYRSSASIRSA